MAVVPSQHLHSIQLHLVLNANLLVGGDLAVLQPHGWVLDTALARINLADDDNLAPLLHLQFTVVDFTSEQPDDLVLAQVGVNVHQHLDFESEEDSVRLALEFLILLARDQLILVGLNRHAVSKLNRLPV